MFNRIGSLMFGSIAICLALLILFGLANGVREAANLAANGKAVTGTVTRYNLQIRNSRKLGTIKEHNYTIEFDGHKKVFDLGQEVPVGSQINLFYLKGNPDSAILSNEDRDFVSVLKKKGTGWSIFLLFVFAAGGTVAIRAAFARTKQR